MARRFKMMPLRFPFNVEKMFWHNCVQDNNSIDPVFHKNGYYLDRYSNDTWLEIDGKAWLYGTRQQFQYDLDCNEGNNRIHNDVFKAIGILISYRLADEKLQQIYLIEDHLRQIRHVYAASRIHATGMLKRIRNKMRSAKQIVNQPV